MRRHAIRPQRTICRPAEIHGVGFLTGAEVRVRFVPAPPGSGLVFTRVDLPGQPRILAHVTQVTGTQRRTTLGRAPAQVTMVEHVLAALAGLRIDNCLIEIDSLEPPGLDGSCRGYSQVLVEAGTRQQAARRTIWAPTEAVSVKAGTATLTIYPPTPEQGNRLVMSYFLDYGAWSPITRQVYTQTIAPGSFLHDIAPCRTFLLREEAEEIRRQGLGTKTKPSDLLVFGPHGPIDNALRFANEPARHKVLDMVGDLSLVGIDLCGHVVACRSGHPLNIELAQAIQQRLVLATQCLAAA